MVGRNFSHRAGYITEHGLGSIVGVRNMLRSKRVFGNTLAEVAAGARSGMIGDDRGGFGLDASFDSCFVPATSLDGHPKFTGAAALCAGAHSGSKCQRFGPLDGGGQ